MAEQQDEAQMQRMMTVMTTEHYNMQSARSATISDSSGRSSLFLGSVSSTLVALGFIGQVSQMGSAFFVFSLVLLPTLYFLGLVTFMRTLQSGIEDSLLGRGINRIRHYYVEVVPEARNYLILSTHDDNAGMARNMGVRMGRWQLFLDAAGMISVVTSVIGGACGALVLHVLGVHAVPLDTAGGMAIFLLSVALLQRHQERLWAEADSRVTVLFPSEDDTDQSRRPPTR